MTFGEAAAVINETSEQTISYVSGDQDEWVAAFLAAGVPPQYGHVLRRLTDAVAAGNGSRPNNVVEEVAGRKATTFTEFARRNPAAWRPRS